MAQQTARNCGTIYLASCRKKIAGFRFLKRKCHTEAVQSRFDAKATPPIEHDLPDGSGTNPLDCPARQAFAPETANSALKSGINPTVSAGCRRQKAGGSDFGA